MELLQVVVECMEDLSENSDTPSQDELFAHNKQKVAEALQGNTSDLDVSKEEVMSLNDNKFIEFLVYLLNSLT